jgi:hypothetical protein
MEVGRMSMPAGTLVRMGWGLQGALLLARGRAEGILLLTAREEPALAAAAHSFWAAALCLPAFICLQLIDLAEAPRLPPHAAHGLALQLLGYVIDWAGFALLSRVVAGAMGRLDAWPRFIAAWNWCNVVQYLLLVAASLPPLLELPPILGETGWLVATGWALWLEWYATRLALGVGGLQAAGLVVLDEALGFGLLALIQALPGNGL